MSYPQRLLSAGERIVVDLRPHWRVLVWPGLCLPVIVGAAGFLAAVAPHGHWQQALRLADLAVAGLLLGLLCLKPYLGWRTTSYVVTDRRVVVRTGVLGRSGRDVPLSRINDVTFRTSLLERLLGSGTLTIESAGERGQLVMAHVPRVQRVQRTVYDLVAEADDRHRGQPSDR